MYTIVERTALSKRIAKISSIDSYRMLLRSYGSKRAGRIILDQQQLAESLVYELLGKMTAEDLLSQTASSNAAQVISPSSTIVTTIKKKLQNLKNTLMSAGKILKIGLFRRRI